MIAFGVAISDEAVYRRFALPGIERAAGPGSLLFTRVGLPIRTAYNEIMDEAMTQPGLEALVLLHQDFELTDGSLPVRLHYIFNDPRVGLVGSLGARDVALHLWLSSRDLYGMVVAPGIDRRFSSGPQQVEAVDGALLVLAPWVVRGLRFGGEPAGAFHGYDIDIAMRVRARGGTTVCEDIPHFHHRESTDDYDAQRLAGTALARMWDPALRPRQWSSSFQL